MNAQYPVATTKTTTSRSNALVAYTVKKYVNNISSGGGDKNPPSRKIECSHKLPVRKKIKTPLQEEENILLENDIQILSLEDMCWKQAKVERKAILGNISILTQDISAWIEKQETW
jgi:hypothetical protein